MSALCDGIERTRRTIWRCPHRRCRRRRWASIRERYDSFIITCHDGHTWITGDPDGLYYAGIHLRRSA